jgi:hypothetical protein
MLCDLGPKLWLRYLYYIFVMWPHGESNLNNIPAHPNGLKPTKKSTTKRETPPFFDVLVETLTLG